MGTTDLIILSTGLCFGCYGLMRSVVYDRVPFHRKIWYLGLVATNITALRFLFRKPK